MREKPESSIWPSRFFVRQTNSLLAANGSHIPEAGKRFEWGRGDGVRSCGVICCDSFMISKEERERHHFSLFTSFERAKSVHLHTDKDPDESFHTTPESDIHTILVDTAFRSYRYVVSYRRYESLKLSRQIC